MEFDPSLLSAGALAALATGGGAPVWAGAITFVINVLKTAGFTPVEGREKMAAFVLSGLLQVGAFITALGMTPPAIALDVPGLLLSLMTWFTVGRLAMALHDDTKRRPGSLTEPSADELRRTDPQATIPAAPPAPPVAPGDVPGDSP